LAVELIEEQPETKATTTIAIGNRRPTPARRATLPPIGVSS
jgi:hypothetical protein